ncbi:hybrid sensor histidine kinase/response regulator [Chrysiogenes arsenatis]|uniref:hybrid sensor histidine kinase/response regulator n=1 Tax=Chrysiogenes arsenatis TaxID=309797 RepID=UPI00040BF7A4|nr:hybrid sensor histidine kinase/response regulator [Chrysiogenes arsenatis]
MYSSPLSLILLEDEVAHATAIIRAISRDTPQITVRHAQTVREFFQMESEHTPDCALIDMRLPDGTAFEILNHEPEKRSYPILIMTSYGDEKMAVAAMKGGALDYIVKSNESFSAMPRSILRSMREWNTIQENHTIQAALLESQTKQREAAEAASRLKSSFISRMSHEFRTPINGIVGSIELALQDDVNEEHKQHLRTARNSARSLAMLLSDLLLFADQESGTIQFKQEEFELAPLLDTVWQTLAILTPDKGLTYSTHLADAVPRTLKGDSERVHQILYHLLSNAVKFTDTGSVQLEVTLKPDTDHSSPMLWLVFTIRDSGIGIPAGRQEQIFDPFVQIDDSETRRFGGSGLGLSIVRQVIRALNGTIQIMSQLGRGSTFLVELPFTRVPENTANLPSTHDAEGHAKKILLVDDNKVNLELVMKLLQRRKFLTESAINGQEALDMLARESFDLVLMDVEMPVMDGLQATRAIRSGAHQGINSDIPVLALTAYTSAEDWKRCLDAGMNDVLAKPIDVTKLFGKINEFTASGSHH